MYDIVNSFMMSQIYLRSHKWIGALQFQLRPREFNYNVV